MAWNEPGGSKDQDPWGNRNKDQQSPPDLDKVIKDIQEKLGGLFGGKGGKGDGGDQGGSLPSGPGKGAAAGMGILILLVIAGIVIANMIYIIQPAERGVVLRFGKYVDTIEPGLNFRLPWPIETVQRVNVDQIRNVEIGYRSGGGRSTQTTAAPSEALMLTRDENIIDVQFAIQYMVKSAKDYLYSVRDPDLTLREATESAVREVVGKSNMDFVLTEGRSDIVARVQSLIQKILDRYNTGLTVTSVNMQNAQPPEQVQHAFDDAVKAREDEQRVINEAEAYANDVLPKARGAAARLIEEGNAYKEQIVARAEGESQRFEQILTEYEKAPEVTRQRLYLETIEGVLEKSSKVMVDVEGGNNLLYLPLDKIMQQQTVPVVPQTMGGASSALDIRSAAGSPTRDFIQQERDSLRSRERR